MHCMVQYGNYCKVLTIENVTVQTKPPIKIVTYLFKIVVFRVFLKNLSNEQVAPQCTESYFSSILFEACNHFPAFKD